MIIVANRIYVHPDHTAAFEERFLNRASMVDQMPGFVAYQLLRPVQPEDPYIVMTTWESQAAFEAWTSSDAFKQGHARSGTLPEGTFTQPNKMEIHEIIQKT